MRWHAEHFTNGEIRHPPDANRLRLTSNRYRLRLTSNRYVLMSLASFHYGYGAMSLAL